MTSTGYNKNRICAFTGGFVPFAKTKAERVASNDPRPSLEERYQNLYMYYFTAAQIVNEQVAARYLLPEDGSRVFRSAIGGILTNNLLPHSADDYALLDVESE